MYSKREREREREREIFSVCYVPHIADGKPVLLYRSVQWPVGGRWKVLSVCLAKSVAKLLAVALAVAIKLS